VSYPNTQVRVPRRGRGAGTPHRRAEVGDLGAGEEVCMRRLGLPSIALFVVASFALAGVASAHKHHPKPPPKQLMVFRTMYGVDGPFVGDANPLDGIPGDELPWVVEGRVHGHLDSSGFLFLQIRGLVFKDDPSVPPDKRGKNDETEFRAAVSCLSEDGDQVVRRNVVTDGFPADEEGNSLIVTHVELPNPCVAPAVLVLAGSEDKWFAVTGFEAEEDQ
jgi:hypothetical protein